MWTKIKNYFYYIFITFYLNDHHYRISVDKTRLKNSKTRYVALTKLSLGVSERLDYFWVANR